MAEALDRDQVSQRLRQLMEHRSLSQTEFAQQLGLTDGYVSQIVRGRKRPSIELCFALRQEYGVSVAWLLTGEGSMYGGAIHLDLHRAIRVQVASARAAVLDGNAVARELLDFFAEQAFRSAAAERRCRKLLEQLTTLDADLDFANELYNLYVSGGSGDTQRRRIVEGALKHFEAMKGSDKLNNLTRALGENSSTWNAGVLRGQSIAG